jgi:glycosyltransferase involved in cell wall biosynthesis
MKITFVVDGSLDQVSGGYLYDRRLADHMRARGDDVEVVSLPPGSYLSRLKTNFDTHLLRRLTESDAEVILQDELSHPGLFLLNQRLRRSQGPPVIAIVHHLRASESRAPPLRAFFRAIERRYLAGVDGLVFNSHATRAAAAELIGQGKASVVAPPAGDRLGPLPDEAAIRARAHEPGPLRLLFVGNLIRRKGLLALLEAMAELPPSLARLEVIGDATFEPGYASAVRRRIDRRGLADRVVLSGPLYDRRLAERMAVSQALVVPSEYEGFGIVYLEGMGFGLPAIGSTAGGASEIIREGETGHLVSPGDIASLAGRIRGLSNDRVRLESMSISARRFFRTHPTWSQSAERVRRFLVEVVPRHAGHPLLTPMEEPI